MPHDKKRIRPVIEEVTQTLPTPETQAVVEEIAVEENKHSQEHTSHEEKVREVITELETLHPQKTKEQKTSRGSNFKMLFLITVFTALAVGFISGGIYVYITGLKTLDTQVIEPTPQPTKKPEVSPSPMPTVSPSASPISAADKAKYKVQILNGSGKIGEAGKAKTLVEKTGFKVVNTANAANYSFTDTIIEAKESVSSNIIDELTKSLVGTYSVRAGENLKATSTYDIIITVGSK